MRKKVFVLYAVEGYTIRPWSVGGKSRFETFATAQLVAKADNRLGHPHRYVIVNEEVEEVA